MYIDSKVKKIRELLKEVDNELNRIEGYDCANNALEIKKSPLLRDLIGV